MARIQLNDRGANEANEIYYKTFPFSSKSRQKQQHIEQESSFIALLLHIPIFYVILWYICMD